MQGYYLLTIKNLYLGNYLKNLPHLALPLAASYGEIPLAQEVV
jgi:hypothetical protein